MSTRDELAEGVMDNLNPENFMDEAVKVKITLHMKPVIEALLSQGWRPPMREISTVEELEALPGKTVIEDGDGDPWIKAEAPLMDSWMYAGLEYSSENMFWGIRCPFRVVWEPEQ